MAVLDKFRLDGKVALITGGGRNLGRETARSFAEAGADIVVTSRTLSEVEKTAEEVRKIGRKALALVMDVTNFADVQEVVRRIVSEMGKIDILVNNATARSHKSIVDVSEEEWRNVIETNLMGSFYCCKAVVPYMIQQKGGRIINLSSRAGLRGRPNLTAYCASKGGVNQLTRSLALELAPYNILVNAIAPGLLNTDRYPKSSPEVKAQRTAKIPLKRVAELSEITPLILYLATEASSYVTGEVILVDGGTAAQ